MTRNVILLAGLAACAVEAPAPEGPVVHVRYGQEARPMPNDLLRDAERGRLDIPAEPEDLTDKTPAEIALIRALNRRDGWPSAQRVSLELDAPIDPRSVARGLRIYEDTPSGLVLVPTSPLGIPEAAPTRLELAPPAGGWTRGRRYVGVALGGENGLVGLAGEPVVGDAAFWFLRLEVSLLEHVEALPGVDLEEKRATAERLEKTRRALTPHFAALARVGLPRARIAALWTFTISRAPEIVMDKDAGKMPLPSDLLRNPATGLVDLPARDEDDEITRSSKRDLNRLDGFALSASLTFEATAPLAALTATSVRLFAIEDALRPVELAIETRDGGRRVLLTPKRPLAPATDHLVVLSPSVHDGEGNAVAPMLPGTIAMLDTPVFDGKSLISALDDESAARVELMRASTHRGLTLLDEEVAAAWSFRTMTVVPQLLEARGAAAGLGLSPHPTELERRSPAAAALDFLAGALTLLRVEHVFEGSILVPDYLDPITRAARPDGGWAPKKLRFTMTIPRNARAELPVVIFGHGLMADRRFVLSIGDALAAEGLAGIAIDFPYHGERSYCSWSGAQCLVNPFNLERDPTCPPPCARGSMCAADGRCVDNGGQGNALNQWPLVNFPVSSGGAFVDVEHIAATRDHFYQAVREVSALRRALLEGDWSGIGHRVRPQVGYVGQSLGGVVGSLIAASHPEMERVVLNVPGADLVDLFRTSTVFKPHIDHFFAKEKVEPGSERHDQFLNIARWLTDAVDPQSFARFLLAESIADGRPLRERRTFIQLARFDAVIPNRNTRVLAELSGVQLVEYLAEHAFLIVPVEPAFIRGTSDMARLLGRGELP